MATTYLYRDVSSASNRRTWTWSAWIKRSSLSGNQSLFTSRTDNSNYATIRLEPDRFHIFDLVSSSFNYRVKTNRKLKDVNGWYHLVVAFDTTQATASNRVKLYVNGVQETDLAESSYPAQNYEGFINRNRTHYIGQGGNLGDKFDGSMSHINFVDGTALTPSSFGSTDSTTGEWKINTNPSVTYGTEGYFILKDGNSLTDQSPNSNNYTASGTLTKTEDCPSNVFATLDAIQYKTSALTYSNGNTTVSFPGAWVFALSQLGVSSGKYYWEAKCNSGNNANSFFGICAEIVPTGNGFYNASQNGAIMYKVGSGETYIDASYNSSGYSPSINNTDIVGLALDLDSGTKTLKIYKNGTLLSSGGTINLSSYYNDTLVFPCFQGNSSSASCSFNVNFGNGYFGTTAVSSAGTNASNNGIFEYDVPAGYTALSTKGLNL